eukprot:CAMPEP_0115859308 /NCGR_PEP_ID=MMETSP0287-20121206/16549_1 /TAXON_ID=412157 /ORGANISM="Chrysochromulina rotalis, Strain UIO044" /LENGTH=94 /DNA_ID=CAMNT_0003313605 /DNA_START=544 /DNA_END=829 /DNA_ORIENTATION=+
MRAEWAGNVYSERLRRKSQGAPSGRPIRATRESLPVGMEVEPEDLLHVTLEGLDSPACAHVPQADDGVEAGRGDERAVRMEAHRVQRPRVPLLQ